MANQAALNRKTSEERLIRAGQRGDAQALNTLFLCHRRSLYHSALGIMGNPEDAEDALQDGLLSAFCGLRRFEGRSRFSTWLTRIVVNAAFMRRRGLATRPAKEAAESHGKDEIPIEERLVSKSANPEQLLVRLETREIINGHLDELSPVLRTVFTLRIMRECTTNEAAKILGISVDSVKARLWRARRALAKRLSRTLFHDTSQTKFPQLVSAAASCD
ncbi:MAG TPA: sigma-70 family RNA polymerase sigma factor [Candidatus Dormibacteraeota bacterium]|jgi:RNA polymerase sigma-70 factor (ECF subfamily)|nr:sigma-70 family RNA polymerase sigma factor [Candidatus Dormibacteraeota bacterium]